MTERYEATYGAGPEPMTLIFPEGGFESLPFEVRLMTPWYGCDYIDSRNIKPAYRYDIMRQGYAVIQRNSGRVSRAA